MEFCAEQCFADCAELEQLALPEGLCEIAEERLSGCAALRELNIPGSVQRIGRDAFSGCAKLKSIRGAKQLLTGENIRNTPYGEKQGICSHCGAKLGLFGSCSRCKKARKYK